MFIGYSLRKLKKVSAPAPAYRDALRSQLMGGATRTPQLFLRSAALFAAFVLFAVFGIGSYAYASPAAIESSALYSVKLKLENLEAKLHGSADAKARFRSKILQRRVREAVYRHNHGIDEGAQGYQNVASELDATAGTLENTNNNSTVRAEVRAEVEAIINEFRLEVSADGQIDERKIEILEHIDQRLDSLSL